MDLMTLAAARAMAGGGGESSAALEPFTVTYSISGAEGADTFSLLFDHTVAEIAAAEEAGREVKAQIVMEDTPFTLPVVVNGTGFGVVMYSIVGAMNAMTGVLTIVHIADGNESARAIVRYLAAEDRALPAVDSGDDGKVLTVVNGEWTAVAPA